LCSIFPDGQGGIKYSEFSSLNQTGLNNNGDSSAQHKMYIQPAKSLADVYDFNKHTTFMSLTPSPFLSAFLINSIFLLPLLPKINNSNGLQLQGN
jgi:hypothetical protein